MRKIEEIQKKNLCKSLRESVLKAKENLHFLKIKKTFSEEIEASIEFPSFHNF